MVLLVFDRSVVHADAVVNVSVPPLHSVSRTGLDGRTDRWVVVLPPPFSCPPSRRAFAVEWTLFPASFVLLSCAPKADATADVARLRRCLFQS